MLTKKRLVLLTILMAGVYFFLLMFFLPSAVVEPRSQSGVLFIFKISFLSMTSAIMTSIILIIIFRKSFVKRQVDTLNRFKYLLVLLVKRDFVSRYRRSALGVLWSLLNPLLTMLVMTMVFSFIFRYQIDYFPIYLLSGQIIFGFFNESTTLAMNSIIGSAGIIKKVYVPKYVFPVSRVLSSLVNLFFSFLAFLLVFIVIRAPFHWTIFLVPIPIVYTFVFSLGMGMILSSLTVFFRDITYLYSVFTTLLMYMTPLFYPVSALPERVQQILGLNPLYHFVDYFRNLALYGVVPGLWANMVCIGFAVATLCCGLYMTMSQQDKYILYL